MPFQIGSTEVVSRSQGVRGTLAARLLLEVAKLFLVAPGGLLEKSEAPVPCLLFGCLRVPILGSCLICAASCLAACFRPSAHSFPRAQTCASILPQASHLRTDSRTHRFLFNRTWKLSAHGDATREIKFWSGISHLD